MVHNPIYSGSEYESIHPQYETLQLVPQQQHNIMASSTPESGNPTRHTISTAKTCQSLSDDLVLNSSGSQVPSN